MIEEGRLKDSYPIFFADSFIAPYVYVGNTILFHKDLKYLPFKKEFSFITFPMKK